MCDVDQQLKKLIQILTIAVQCGNLTVDDTQFTSSIQNVLQMVLSNNLSIDPLGFETKPSDDDSIVAGLNLNNGGSEGNGSDRQRGVGGSGRSTSGIAVSTFAKYLPPTITTSTTSSFGFGIGNATAADIMVNNSGGYGTGVNFPGGGMEVTKMTDPMSGHRLHRLEIIKVVVLIVVISIILISTCRMVLQLFLRFRPEKNNDYI